MKKLLVGFAIIGTLAIYSLGIRHEQPKLSMPTSLKTGSPTGNVSGSAGLNSSNSSTSGVSSSASTPSQASTHKDGSYTGSVEDAFYGNVQVRITVRDSKITDVTFLQYPNTHSTSVYINQQAMPYLQQEAIKAQSANVDIVSGATYTSQAFIQSLSNALSQAS